MFFEGNIWLIEISFKYYNKKKIEECIVVMLCIFLVRRIIKLIYLYFVKM